MEFSRQEYWSGLSRPPPGNLPDPESLASPALAGRFFTTSATWEPLVNDSHYLVRMVFKKGWGRASHIPEAGTVHAQCVR